jgi:hypothetical protein
MTLCLPIALDLGHYEAHTYVHPPVTVALFRFKSDQKHRPTADHTGFAKYAQLFKVGVFPDLDRPALNLTYSTRLLKL